jgi:hypothetical protein
MYELAFMFALFLPPHRPVHRQIRRETYKNDYAMMMDAKYVSVPEILKVTIRPCDNDGLNFIDDAIACFGQGKKWLGNEWFEKRFPGKKKRVICGTLANERDW